MSHVQRRGFRRRQAHTDQLRHGRSDLPHVDDTEISAAGNACAGNEERLPAL
jgi:hypothetical protein